MIESANLDKLNKDLDKIAKELFKDVEKIPDVITQRLGEGANDIRSTIIMSMRETKRATHWYWRSKGRKRKKKGPGFLKSAKRHYPSAPGNPPAIDSGELVRSITFDVRKMEIEVGVSGGGEYAKYLEGGTHKFSPKHGLVSEKMEPRPFLGPAVEKHHKEIINDIGEDVFELIKEPFEKI